MHPRTGGRRDRASSRRTSLVGAQPSLLLLPDSAHTTARPKGDIKFSDALSRDDPARYRIGPHGVSNHFILSSRVQRNLTHYQ